MIYGFQTSVGFLTRKIGHQKLPYQRYPVIIQLKDPTVWLGYK